MLRRSFLPLLAGLALLASCGGGDSVTGTQDDVTGTYALQTINAQALPFTLLQIGADRIEITSSALTLNADGSFTEVASFRLTESGVTTTQPGTSVGTYTRNGNNLRFTQASDGFTYNASWDGDRQITQTVGDLTIVYRK